MDEYYVTVNGANVACGDLEATVKAIGNWIKQELQVCPSDDTGLLFDFVLGKRPRRDIRLCRLRHYWEEDTDFHEKEIWYRLPKEVSHLHEELAQAGLKKALDDEFKTWLSHGYGDDERLYGVEDGTIRLRIFDCDREDIV